MQLLAIHNRWKITVSQAPLIGLSASCKFLVDAILLLPSVLPFSAFASYGNDAGSEMTAKFSFNLSDRKMFFRVTIQRSAEKYANLAKQDPGKARQSS